MSKGWQVILARIYWTLVGRRPILGKQQLTKDGEQGYVDNIYIAGNSKQEMIDKILGMIGGRREIFSKQQ